MGLFSFFSKKKKIGGSEQGPPPNPAPGGDPGGNVPAPGPSDDPSVFPSLFPDDLSDSRATTDDTPDHTPENTPDDTPDHTPEDTPDDAPFANFPKTDPDSSPDSGPISDPISTAPDSGASPRNANDTEIDPGIDPGMNPGEKGASDAGETANARETAKKNFEESFLSELDSFFPELAELAVSDKRVPRAPETPETAPGKTADARGEDPAIPLDDAVVFDHAFDDLAPPDDESPSDDETPVAFSESADPGDAADKPPRKSDDPERHEAISLSSEDLGEDFELADDPEETPKTRTSPETPAAGFGAAFDAGFGEGFGTGFAYLSADKAPERAFGDGASPEGTGDEIFAGTVDETFAGTDGGAIDRGAEGGSEETDADLLPPRPDPSSEMGKLRSLFFERELKQLDRLTDIIDDPQALAQRIAGVITEALLVRSRKDDKLNTVLAPTVEKIFSSSVRRNPETLANQIFPVIGPAIRRSISDTFTSMLQSFNSMLETSFSLKGAKWRLEAWRVHKPFSEIVLLHTLLYHVEEIYLIHAESGLILDHLVYEGGESRDAELVAAMFTAIRDFIRDSFSVGKNEHLDNLRFGERTIFLQRTEKVFMACVVRGNPPASLKQDLQDALELMVVNSADDLDNFSGDPAPFKKNRAFFQPFLVAQYEEKPRKLPFLVRMIPATIVLILLALLGLKIYDDKLIAENGAVEERRAEERADFRTRARASFEKKVNAAIERLNDRPGLAVGRVTEIGDGLYEVVCLKDELAEDPAAVLTEAGDVRESAFRLVVKPFVSMDGPLVRQRIANILAPPGTMEVVFDDATGVISLKGDAPLGWLVSTLNKSTSVAGVKSVDTSGVHNEDIAKMIALVREINDANIRFPLGKAEPIPEDAGKLAEAMDKLKELEDLAPRLQVTISLAIYGHTDATGQPMRNYELSLERTKTVAALLYARGSYMTIRNFAMGSEFSKNDPGADKPVEDLDSRRIELRVFVEGAGANAAKILGLDVGDASTGEIPGPPE
ncbi:MAG: hypothetical protein LBF41_03760 [Deltaproteobacteria bacterium]|jgi:OOP family OmpA-OmpF porin|nr:hypothetical protein [Deltaproteobacteria bacterium]